MWWKKRSNRIAKRELQSALEKEINIVDSGEESSRTPSPASAKSSRWLCFTIPRKRRASREHPPAMKKFGFGKKSEKSEGDDGDRNRMGLFGRKAPSQDDNPYAQQPAEDPYARMTPYQQARANLANGPRPGAVGLPAGPAPRGDSYGIPPPGSSYQSSPQIGGPVSGGYAPDKFGAPGGYGGNRYDAGASRYGAPGSTASLPSQNASRFPSRGPGGYGGMGSTDNDANRDDLLAGARQRQTPSAPPSYTSTDNTGSGESGASGGSYGGYGEERELTEEELQDQEYGGIKNKIEETMTETEASLDRTLYMIDQAEQTGTSSLARLAGQRERLHNTQKNLDLAHNQHRVANDKTRKLETLNRSMLAVSVSNPFTSKQRMAEKDRLVLERHQMERENREAIRNQQFNATQNMDKTFNQLARPAAPTVLLAANREARSKFEMLEDDDDGGEWAARQAKTEVAIDAKLDKASEGVARLHMLALGHSQEVDEQNVLIDHLQVESDNLDDGVRVTRAHLERIR